MAKEIEPQTGDKNFGTMKKLGVFLFVAAVVVVAYTQYGDLLSLESLAKQEAQLRAFQAENPVLVYGVAFLVYVVVTGLSLPGAAVLTLVYGWYFGLAPGLLLVSFASTAGATMAFLLSRFLFREAIQKRFGDRLQSFNQSLEKEGPFFLFTLRLIPAVPFFIINAVMGLTPIRTRTFWWVSQLGMLAGTAVFVYAGSSVPDLQTLADKGIGAVFTPSQLTQIVIAFVLLGAFPLVVRFSMKFFGRAGAEPVV
ncbi:membrane protein containing SNARE domain protein [Rhodopirellula islandica]|uniref:TVP38/TMEM64 family membrane protein n=1 Tax=Rhodopirellula islandica TaxID=595434 RepID=A0A0J1EN51_RHOIS|nr:TVP38/TMEM64 family protein [Rhodopirellula islandica]KLU06904.1 membrane protein containing SNARE domain protein [Rhodopirellula islandica]